MSVTAPFHTCIAVITTLQHSLVIFLKDMSPMKQLAKRSING